MTGKQRRFLRAMGSGLDPILQVGKEGVTEGTIRQVDEALEARELIKVRVLRYCPEETGAVAGELANATGSDVAQTIGHTILLFRPSVKKPQIILPE